MPNYPLFSIPPDDTDEEEQVDMKISNYDNVFLLTFKMYATVGSGSFAIASSFFDSLLDLMGGGITHLSMKNINTKDHYFDVVTNIVGLLAASPELLQKLVFRHPEIKRIDTVGVLYSVEVDIELPKELPLKEAHAIGENLQMKLEKLPEVERAFVYLDFECDHKPEHNVLSKPPHPFCR